MTSAIGLGGITVGARAVLRGLRRVLSEPTLRRLSFLPILLTILLYGGILVLAAYFVGDLVRWVVPQPPSGELRLGWYVLLALAYVGVGVLLVVFFLSAVNLIAGPFYDAIAERILDDKRAPKAPLSFLRALRVEALWSLSLAPIALTLWLLALVPVVGVVFATLEALLLGVALATSAAGPALNATGHGFRDRLLLWRRAPLLMGGIAVVMGVSALIPVLGLVILPAGVVGATEALSDARLLDKKA
ncbi:MAG: EI24 domain-containing protein [Myxococcota bacterium]